MTDYATKDERIRLLWLPLTAAALAVLGTAFGAAVLPNASVTALGTGLLGQLAATLVVARSERHPQLGLAAVVAVGSAMLLIDSPWRELMVEQGVLWLPVALAWASVLVLELARTPRQLVVAGAFVAVYLVVAGARAVSDGEWAVGTVLTAATPILGGLAVSQARRLRRARHDRLAALNRERAARQREEKEKERQQLATEIHDSLGHLLTLLVLHANALAVTTTDDNTRGAAAQISRLGTDGLTELRHLLELLGSTDDPAPPQLDELVGEARAAGQDVQLTVEGDLAALSPTPARTVRQVVREGLTNARRHALGARVQVEIVVTDAAEVVVCNGPGEPGAGRGSGLGLANLRRRVALLDGDLRNGPTGDGGYALRASFPNTSADGQDAWTEQVKPCC